MSVRAIAWAWAQPVRPSARKFVLIAVADEADDTGSCWPSQGRIADKCGLHVRTVRTHLAALEAEGYLTRSPRYPNSGARRTFFLYRQIFPGMGQ
jgi:DNA-binding MarR family transcriptional regulator